MTTSEKADPNAAPVAALYPFLYPETAAGTVHPDLLIDEVRRSIVDKVAEIVALRADVLDRDGERISACAQQMAAAFASGGRLFAFGNGGSATDAADLVSLFLDPGPGHQARPAHLLTGDVAVLTALTNDVGFGAVFARQLSAFGRQGDIAVGLSTSGNSANLLSAFEEAHRRGMLTVGLSGSSGGRMAELADIDHHFVVPSTSVHRIQEAQTTIYHVLWQLTFAALDELAVRPATPHGPDGGGPARQGR